MEYRMYSEEVKNEAFGIVKTLYWTKYWIEEGGMHHRRDGILNFHSKLRSLEKVLLHEDPTMLEIRETLPGGLELSEVKEVLYSRFRLLLYMLINTDTPPKSWRDFLKVLARTSI